MYAWETKEKPWFCPGERRPVWGFQTLPQTQKTLADKDKSAHLDDPAHSDHDSYLSDSTRLDESDHSDQQADLYGSGHSDHHGVPDRFDQFVVLDVATNSDKSLVLVSSAGCWLQFYFINWKRRRKLITIRVLYSRGQFDQLPRSLVIRASPSCFPDYVEINHISVEFLFKTQTMIFVVLEIMGKAHMSFREGGWKKLGKICPLGYRSELAPEKWPKLTGMMTPLKNVILLMMKVQKDGRKRHAGRVSCCYSSILDSIWSSGSLGSVYSRICVHELYNCCDSFEIFLSDKTTTSSKIWKGVCFASCVVEALPFPLLSTKDLQLKQKGGKMREMVWPIPRERNPRGFQTLQETQHLLDESAHFDRQIHEVRQILQGIQTDKLAQKYLRRFQSLHGIQEHSDELAQSDRQTDVESDRRNDLVDFANSILFGEFDGSVKFTDLDGISGNFRPLGVESFRLCPFQGYVVDWKRRKKEITVKDPDRPLLADQSSILTDCDDSWLAEFSTEKSSAFDFQERSVELRSWLWIVCDAHLVRVQQGLKTPYLRLTWFVIFFRSRNWPSSVDQFPLLELGVSLSNIRKITDLDELGILTFFVLRFWSFYGRMVSTSYGLS